MSHTIHDSDPQHIRFPNASPTVEEEISRMIEAISIDGIDGDSIDDDSIDGDSIDGDSIDEFQILCCLTYSIDEFSDSVLLDIGLLPTISRLPAVNVVVDDFSGAWI